MREILCEGPRSGIGEIVLDLREKTHFRFYHRLNYQVGVRIRIFFLLRDLQYNDTANNDFRQIDADAIRRMISFGPVHRKRTLGYP